MIAGPRHTRHFTSAAGDDGSHLDDVAVLEESVAGNERAVGDNQMGFAVQLEAIEEYTNPNGTVDLHLATRIPEQDLHGKPPLRRRA